MHQSAKGEQYEQRHAEDEVQTIDNRHPRKMRRGTSMEGHHRLRPTHQFHHLAAIHMPGGKWNSQQAEADLYHQQADDHKVADTGVCPHPRIE